jgi:hypothetical protein
LFVKGGTRVRCGGGAGSFAPSQGFYKITVLTPEKCFKKKKSGITNPGKGARLNLRAAYPERTTEYEKGET